MNSARLKEKNKNFAKNKLFSKIADWQQAKILILGFGREGQDTFLFLRRLFPEKVLGVGDRLEFGKFDKKAQEFIENEKCSGFIRLHLGENYLKTLKNYDLIIKSPGIPPKSIISFLGKKQKITSQTEIFFENFPGKIIGITGTKGKGSTALMIYQILKKRNLKFQPVKFASQTFNRVNLVGNIGKPVLNLLLGAKPSDIYIYELSSHQLHNLKPVCRTSRRQTGNFPQIAVFLNIYPDHLDYYQNFKEYIRAKSNIVFCQEKEDYLIYNAEDKIIKEIAKKSKAKKTPIKGKYYQLNKEAAKAVSKILKIDSKTVKKAIEDFKPLAHRLEFIGTFRGIAFYNDSSATIPQATVAAIESLGERAETIILGGFDKKIDFKELGQKILDSNVKNIILFPTTGEKIVKSIEQARRKFIVRQKEEERERKKEKEKKEDDKGKKKTEKKKIEKERFLNYFFVNPKDKPKSLRGKKAMKEAVALAYEHTLKGKICLFSPACASFGLFKDYEERGNLFKKQVFAQQGQRKQTF